MNLAVYCDPKSFAWKNQKHVPDFSAHVNDIIGISFTDEDDGYLSRKIENFSFIC